MTDDWLREARRKFGDRQDVFHYAGNTPGGLWLELTQVFEKAYEEPRCEADIEAIYAYADWCLLQPQGTTADDDLGTIVATYFYEGIPVIPAAAEDMPRWFRREDVVVMREIFSYMGGSEAYERVLSYFPENVESD